MKRVVFFHGLGDCIQALPALEAYARRVGDKLSIGTLRRLQPCAEVFRGCPFVESTFVVADPWHDFHPPDTWQGYRSGIDAMKVVYPDALVVEAKRPTDPRDAKWCKALRIADELGVGWHPVRPTLHLEGYTKGVAYAEDVRRARPLVALHDESGNPAKDVEIPTLAQIAKSRLGFGQEPWFVPLPVRIGGILQNLAFHAGFLSEVDLFVGVDSGPAHLASVVARRVVWVFTATPVEQAVPLWRDVEVVVAGPRADELAASWSAWKRANPTLVPHTVTLTKGSTDVQARSSAR